MENQEQKTEILSEKQSPRKHNLIEGIKALGLKIYEVFREYPVTMGAIIIAALIGAILIDMDSRSTEEFLEKALAFFLIWSFQTLTFEECFSKKPIVRIAGTAVSALISAFCVYIFQSEAKLIFGAEADSVKEMLARTLIVYAIIMVGMSIYHMFRRLEDDFETYATKAFLELLKASVIYGLFALGLAIIILIFNELIFDTDEFLGRVELFLAGGIYAPMCLKAISGKNEHPGKFFRFCILFVLQPMLLIAFAIIYLYIIKIFVTNDIPSNRIFYILSFLFAIGMPIWTLIHGFQEKIGVFAKVTPFLPYIFLPFVILQCWSIGVRINAYGITPSRYGAVILILCECIYFALYTLHHIKKQETISYLLFALMGVSFLTILFPGIRYDDTVIRSQMKRLIAQAQVLDEKDANATARIKQTYNAIRRVSYKGEKALEENFSKSQLETFGSYSAYSYRQYESVYLNADNCFDGVDISAYSKAYSASASGTPRDGILTLNLDRRKYLFDENLPENIQIDLSDLIEWSMQNYKVSYTRDYDITGHEIIPIDSRMDFVIDYVSLDYRSDTKEVSHLSTHGFLMLK